MDTTVSIRHDAMTTYMKVGEIARIMGLNEENSAVLLNHYIAVDRDGYALLLVRMSKSVSPIFEAAYNNFISYLNAQILR